MKTLLVTGSDTGVGKTRVTGALARLLSARSADLRIVKPVETGAPNGHGDDEAGDAQVAARAAGLPTSAAHTMLRFTAPLAPLAAAAAEGRTLSWSELIDGVNATPPCDWRIIEGAGGLAVPLAEDGRDWADFAREIEADAVVLVVADRLGAINQARLTLAYATARGLRAGVWLNACSPTDAKVMEANRAGLHAAGVPLWGELAFGSWDASPTPSGLVVFADKETRPSAERSGRSGAERWAEELQAREAAGLRRRVRVHAPSTDCLNLAGNDYLGLARDPAVVAAMAYAAAKHGTSASASPLLNGWGPSHENLVETLCSWHGFSQGLLWTSGFAANAGVLGTLPRPGDLVLADRLIHHSMVAGILKSGARLRRYPHLDLDALERLLRQEWAAGDAGARAVFVVTESVFSMDGDYPDLRRLAALRRRFGFCWILDEAHALGWFGRSGAGLAEEQGVASEVDVFVGTGGKALGCGGGYTLFHGGPWREALVNHAGEFIYSTGLPPPVAAAMRAAAGRAQQLAEAEQAAWRAASRLFRARLREAGWAAAEGEAPVVAVHAGAPERALVLADKLRAAGILVAAVRPPTVPAGTSRLRFSLTRGFGVTEMDRVLAALGSAEADVRLVGGLA